MDSLDKSDLFLGKTEKLAREGFPIFCAERLQAVKWRNWKMHFMRQDTVFDPPVKNPVPTIYNLFTDPREEKPDGGFVGGWSDAKDFGRVRAEREGAPADSDGHARSLHAGEVNRQPRCR